MTARSSRVQIQKTAGRQYQGWTFPKQHTMYLGEKIENRKERIAKFVDRAAQPCDVYRDETKLEYC
jgi:hypothetical protein